MVGESAQFRVKQGVSQSVGLTLRGELIDKISHVKCMLDYLWKSPRLPSRHDTRLDPEDRNREFYQLKQVCVEHSSFRSFHSEGVCQENSNVSRLTCFKEATLY